MKNKSITSLLVFLLLFCFKSLAQYECDSSRSERTVRYHGNIANGGVFTPKGNLRVLVIFVSYGDPYDNNDVPGWPSNQEFPDWYYSAEQPFYSSFSQFNPNVYADTNRYSVSNFFYQMSDGQFRLIADYYPRRVRVPVTQDDTWGSIHRRVLDSIRGSANWSLYDLRTKRPYYQTDNSNSSPDGNIDYIVFCHRFNEAMNLALPCDLKSATSNGFDNTAIRPAYAIPGTEYSVTYAGYTHITGGERMIGTFPHEVGHTLFDGPHYGGGNNVAGNYFYLPTAGWGIMNRLHNRNCALGWERYILDWIPQIKASGVASDIRTASDLEATNGEFVLRDFITTGDAIRVKLSTRDGDNQYLWIENHCGYSIFDANVNGASFCNTPIQEYHNGLVAYVEAYSHVKEQSSFSINDSANGIRWLSADGNHDFFFSNIPTPVPQLCGQNTYRFWNHRTNPIGGQNVGERIRGNYDGDAVILYTTRDSGANEGYDVVILNDAHATADYFNGRCSTFPVGSKAGISRNPCVMNIPRYSKALSRMEEYYMNGISFEVLQQYPDGSIRVKVRLDDIDIDTDVRWAGTSMLLTDISGDNRPDINILPYRKVTIDVSGTPNRHTKKEMGEDSVFINPTTFICKNHSLFKLQHHAQLDVAKHSAMVLESGSVLEVGDEAILKIEHEGALYLKTGSTLHVLGRGHVEIFGMVCVEYGAEVVFDNELSAVNLRPGWSQGTNVAVEDVYGTCHCAGFAMHPNVPFGVHEYTNDRYIQNQTYSYRKYINGRNVFVGNHVNQNLPFGDVIIDASGDVIIDGQDDIFLNEGFEVKLGGQLEVR